MDPADFSASGTAKIPSVLQIQAEPIFVVVIERSYVARTWGSEYEIP